MAEMLRNSAAQAEGIQEILSELLQPSQVGKEPEPLQQQTRPRRPRERQRRAELDSRLKVRFIPSPSVTILNAASRRPMCVNMLS